MFPSLGLSHQLRVCDNLLNNSMVLCLRYRRTGVQKDGRGEESMVKAETRILRRLAHERVLSVSEKTDLGHDG